MALAIAARVAAPARATTLRRASLEELVAGNGTIVLGEVLGARSYWNEAKNFILTDVRFEISDVLKGEPKGKEITITILGGRVGDKTTLIIGGPELIPGNSYVLFLNEENLPGVKGATTVRDLVQGVFDLKIGSEGLRAVSQANGHALVPDQRGYFEAEGGFEGMPLTAMMWSVRQIASKPAQEVR